jgi:heterodisulfide reductase subunit B
MSMAETSTLDVSYFPGCSLATTAKENNESLIQCCRKLGINLITLPDWNCCGSSSAHSINHRLALDLACRNLSLAPPGRSLVAACPSCTLRLKHAQYVLRNDASAQARYRQMWGRPFDPGLRIRNFLGLLSEVDLESHLAANDHKRIDLTFVPYYGCMINRPHALRSLSDLKEVMEKTLTGVGLQPKRWAYSFRCCGTFLTVARPDIVTPMINRIMQGAGDSGADCIVTACAMCHMNLEVRCTLKNPVPVFHFSEILSLAFGVAQHKNWFSRHLIDPRPLLKSKGLTDF